MQSPGKSALWTGRVLTLLAALPFIPSALMKFSGSAEVVQGFEHFGWPASAITTLAILELGSVVLYWLPPFSFLGAILLTGYLGGAIATHLRLGEAVPMQVAMGVLIWGGLFLREPKLRVLLPVWGGDRLFEREIEIDCPREEIFAYIKLLKNFKNWNPFLKADPGIKVEYTGIDGQIGFVSAWDGRRSGSGEQEITKIKEGERIEFELRFKKPFQATNTGYFATSPGANGKTKVSWGMYAKPVFPMTVFGLFCRMSKMMNNSFDTGLNDLKSILEKR